MSWQTSQTAGIKIFPSVTFFAENYSKSTKTATACEATDALEKQQRPK